MGGVRWFGRELGTQLYKSSEIVCCCVSLVVDLNCHRYEPMPYQPACWGLYCLQDSLMREKYHPCQIHTIFLAAYIVVVGWDVFEFLCLSQVTGFFSSFFFSGDKTERK